MYAWSEWLTNPDVISQGTSAPMNTASLFTAGSTVGYRFSFGPAFIDLGAGALWYRNRDHVYCVPNCFQPYPDRGPLKHGVFPDGVFGFGFDL